LVDFIDCAHDFESNEKSETDEMEDRIGCHNKPIIYSKRCLFEIFIQ